MATATNGFRIGIHRSDVNASHGISAIYTLAIASSERQAVQVVRDQLGLTGRIASVEHGPTILQKALDAGVSEGGADLE